LSISDALNARVFKAPVFLALEQAKKGAARPSAHTSYDAPLLMMYADKICEKSLFGKKSAKMLQLL
jgi:hypothetical protein